jgi:hypothetical protein
MDASRALSRKVVLSAHEHIISTGGFLPRTGEELTKFNQASSDISTVVT